MACFYCLCERITRFFSYFWAVAVVLADGKTTLLIIHYIVPENLSQVTVYNSLFFTAAGNKMGNIIIKLK